MRGIISVAGRGVDFTRTMREVTRGLRKVYPVTQMSRVPLLSDDMRAIRSVMRRNELRDVIYWAPWASQRQDLMRASDILRPGSEKSRKWESTRDLHVGRITWENVDPAQNGGSKTPIIWRLKPSKTEQSGGKQFEKTFSVDGDRSAISAGFAISSMLHLRG